MAKESIEALLNPSLKVSRPVAACARCRNAKIKCDGKLPACSACERAGKTKECSSASDEFARGKERSYSSALETTVQRLQRKIEEAKAASFRRNSVAMFTHDRPVLERRPISNSRRKEAGNVDEIVDKLGFLTVNATSRDFQGFTSTMSFAKMLKAITLKASLPTFDHATALPPRYTISRYINHYFENLHVMLPFFSETEFMSSLSRIYQEQTGVAVAAPFDMWCFHLVLAISAASLCQTTSDENYDMSTYHISRAMSIDEHVIHPGSISGIQALLLLVQYSLVDPERFDGWYIIGMASRLLVDLGLHCELAPEIKASKQLQDLRRRVFYCTYALDRLVSMALGFAFSFTDDSAPNVLLPTLSTDQEARSPASVFLRSVRPSLFLFDIRRVQSAFYQKTRWSARELWPPETATSYVSSTLDDIRAWQSTLPESFSTTHLKLFNLEALYSQILVLSPNQVNPVANIPESYKTLFFHYVVQYSEDLRSTMQDENIRACLNYSDFCRAQYVSRQLHSVMWANFDLLIKNESPAVSPSYGMPRMDNCSRALLFINNMAIILDWPKKRWGIKTFRDQFEQEFAVLRARLQTRLQEHVTQRLSPASASGTNPYSAAFAAANANTYQPSQPMQQSYVQTSPSHQQYQYDYQQVQQQYSAANGVNQYPGPAVQRSNLVQSNSWTPETGSLPASSSSLPRRSYHFTGGQG